MEADFAEAHFAELLARVSGGEEVTITRNGEAVARLLPVRPRVASTEERRRAIEAIKALGSRNSLNGLSITDLIDEGRS
jgi:prevent-host-death family protein